MRTRTMRAAGLAAVVACGVFVAAGRTTPVRAQVPAGGVEKLTVPPGFTIEVYAANVPFARQLTVAPSGTVFVGAMKLGSKAPYAIHALVDRNKDHAVDEVIPVATGLDTPNGVAFHKGALYVAEMTRIVRFDDVEANLGKPQTPVVIVDKLPGNMQHGWKSIGFGPDGKLYVTIGAPCNVCEVKPEEPRTGSIARMNPDGSGFELVARGVRNSVGLDWHPVTKELWFTNNGRDMLGDDLPPDTLNRVSRAGQDFGFPYCHAGGIPDRDVVKANPCEGVTLPVTTMGPHAAVMGVKFYTGNMFPAEYRNAMFIARKGSWNRTEKFGYDVVTVTTDANGRNPQVKPFLTGFLNADQSFNGRPAYIHQQPDGSLLVSDEQMGAIYRVSYAR